jgi:hypothetical protein
LDVEDNAGITLTESCAMSPGAAVSGYYFSHPDSRYFGVAEIGRDQVSDYAERKGMPSKRPRSGSPRTSPTIPSSRTETTGRQRSRRPRTSPRGKSKIGLTRKGVSPNAREAERRQRLRCVEG